MPIRCRELPASANCKRAMDSAFKDNFHFQCHVYRELNRQLVALL
jgi:hypothetical protein